MFTLQRWVSLSLILTASIALLSCGGAEERKAKYLERGKAYLAEKNYDKAAVELKNVLQIDPKSSEGYFLLGKVEEEKKDYGRAFGDYNKAVELNPDHQEAREKLARIYILSGQPDKAGEMVDYILKKKPNDSGAKIIRCVLLAQKGNTDEALKIALEVMKADPTRTEAALFVSEIHKKNGDRKKAEKVLEESLAINTKDIQLRGMLAHYYYEDNDLEKAEGMLQEIVKLAPDEIAHRVTLASFFDQTKRLDKAEKVLRDAIKADPKDAERYGYLANFLTVHNHSAQAESEILAAIKLYPKEYRLRFSLAAFYVATGKQDQAKTIYSNIIENDRVGPDGMSARKRLAELLLGEKKTEEASSLIAEVLKDNARDPGALLIRGKLAMGKDKPDFQAAISDFRSILKDQPDSAEILMLLAAAHRLNHEPALARESFQKAVKAAPKDANASVRLAEFMVANDKDSDGALKVLNEFLSTTPNDLTVLQAKLNLLGAKKDNNGIIETLARIKKEFPDKPVGYYHAGEFYMSQGKLSEALHEFEQSRDRSKEDFQSVGAISMVYMRMDKPTDSIKVIDGYLSAHPKNLDALQMKAGILASSKDAAGFFKVTDQIKQFYPDQTNGYAMNGEFYLEQKSYDNALREFKAAAEKSPGDTRISSSIIKTYLAEEKPDDALAWLAQQVTSRPNDGFNHYLTAEVLLSQKKYTEAEAQLQKALQLMPERDVENMPKRNDVYIRLADVNVMQNRLDTAVKVLKQGLAVIPDDNNLSVRLASVYELSGQFDDAIATYSAVLKNNPGNALVANNLASLLTDRKGDKASLERARQLAAPFESSDQPALLDTLGWVYYKLDDVDSALPLLKKAVDAAPKSGVLRFHLGMAYYKKGDKKAAKDELTRAFATEQKFTGEDEGRATLKALQ